MPALASQLSVFRVIRILTLALVIVALILCPTPHIEVKADTLSVWKTADDDSEGTLRRTVNDAVSGDMISFDTSQIPRGSTKLTNVQIRHW